MVEFSKITINFKKSYRTVFSQIMPYCIRYKVRQILIFNKNLQFENEIP